jgi:hypothetical protein
MLDVRDDDDARNDTTKRNANEGVKVIALRSNGGRASLFQVSQCSLPANATLVNV